MYRGDPRFAPSPHPRIYEYNRLKYFWKEFGLNKNDLNNETVEWVEEMHQVGVGFEKAKQQLLENSKNKTTPSTIGNKWTKTEKLL